MLKYFKWNSPFLKKVSGRMHLTGCGEYTDLGLSQDDRPPTIHTIIGNSWFHEFQIFHHCFCLLRKSSRLMHHQTSEQYGHTLWLQIRIRTFYYGPLANVFAIFILFYKTSHVFHIHRKPVYRMHQTSKNQRRGPSLQFVEGIFPKNKINMETKFGL